MDSDNKNYEVKYCPEDDEYRVYCEICESFVSKDIIKVILNKELTEIISIKDEKGKISNNLV